MERGNVRQGGELVVGASSSCRGPRRGRARAGKQRRTLALAEASVIISWSSCLIDPPQDPDRVRWPPQQRRMIAAGWACCAAWYGRGLSWCRGSPLATQAGRVTVTALHVGHAHIVRQSVTPDGDYSIIEFLFESRIYCSHVSTPSRSRSHALTRSGVNSCHLDRVAPLRAAWSHQVPQEATRCVGHGLP